MQDAAHLRAGSHKIKHAADDVPGVRSRNAGGLYARTNLDALAASRAGVEHVVNAFAQSRLKGDVGHRQHLPLSPRTVPSGTARMPTAT
jgi:hypothetical protein